MIIQYQNTREEYLEASQALALRKRKKPGIVRWITAAAFFLYGIIGVSVGLMAPPQNSLETTFNLWFPMIVIFIIVFFTTLATMFRSRRPGVPLRAIISLILICVSAVWVIIGFRFGSPPNPNSGSALHWSMLLPHVGWLFLTAIFLVVAFAGRRAQKIGMWEGQPSLHRPKTAEITAQGVIIKDPVSIYDFRWEFFVGWHETKTLIVLFMSDYQVIFFPKHAFQSPEELETMRSLANLIPATRSSAFPVVESANSTPPQAPAIPPPLR